MLRTSAVGALQSGGWRRLRLGPFQIVVAVAGLLDVTTTAEVLLDGPAEANRVLAALAEIDPWLAIGVHSALVAGTVLVAAVDLGWLSTAVGTRAVVAYGSGGLNNAVLLGLGWAPKEALPIAVATQVHVVEPAVGAVVGVALAARWHGRLPLGEVLAYGTFVAGLVVGVQVLG